MSSREIEARRKALYAKRDELRARQAERMKQFRRDKEVAAIRRHSNDALDAANVRYEFIWPEDQSRPSPLPSYPIGFSNIHWDLVPNAVRSGIGHTEEQLKALFDEALSVLGVTPETTVIVDWCANDMPRLALAAADASANVVPLMRCSWDIWVYAPGQQWVIEIYHEGELSYASQPGLPEHAGDRWRPQCSRSRSPHSKASPEGEEGNACE